MANNYHKPEDTSEEIFEGIYSTKLNLMKDIWEVMGYDLQKTEPHIVFKNYLAEDPITLGGSMDLGLGDLGSIDNASLNGLSLDQLMKVFSGAKRDYLGACLLVLDRFGSTVGLNDKGKLFVLAQMGHESGNFRYTHELGNGQGRQYGLPSGPYNKIYYGRGPIQITWEGNYKAISEKYFPQMGIDVDIWKNPELCETNLAVGCAASLAWFLLPGNGQRAVKYANAGDVNGLTKMINGGTNGLTDRINKTKKLLALVT